MITIRLILHPGRLAQPVDELGRPLAVAVPGPVVGSAEPIRFLFLDAELHAVDPAGFADAPALRLAIAQDLDPATTPLYVTNALVRTAAGQYDLEDPSGTYTAEAVAALGVLPAIPCVWEVSALDPNGDWAHPLGVVQAGLPLRNRVDSLSTPSPIPPADLRGPAGKDATVAVGNVETLAPGADPTVRNAGTPSAAILEFGIPGGFKVPGERGADNPDPASSALNRCWIASVAGAEVRVRASQQKYAAFDTFVVGYSNRGVAPGTICSAVIQADGNVGVDVTFPGATESARTISVPAGSSVRVLFQVFGDFSSGLVSVLV